MRSITLVTINMCGGEVSKIFNKKRKTEGIVVTKMGKNVKIGLKVLKM